MNLQVYKTTQQIPDRYLLNYMVKAVLEKSKYSLLFSCS